MSAITHFRHFLPILYRYFIIIKSHRLQDCLPKSSFMCRHQSWLSRWPPLPGRRKCRLPAPRGVGRNLCLTQVRQRSLMDSVAFRHQHAGMARLIRHAAPHHQRHPDASGRHLGIPGCRLPRDGDVFTFQCRNRESKTGERQTWQRTPLAAAARTAWASTFAPVPDRPKPVAARTRRPTTTDRRPLMAVGSARPCHNHHPESRDRHGTRSQCPPRLRREPAFARDCGRQDYHARDLLPAPTNPRRKDMHLPAGTRERSASYPCSFRPGHAPQVHAFASASKNGSRRISPGDRSRRVMRRTVPLAPPCDRRSSLQRHARRSPAWRGSPGIA